MRTNKNLTLVCAPGISSLEAMRLEKIIETGDIVVVNLDNVYSLNIDMILTFIVSILLICFVSGVKYNV